MFLVDSSVWIDLFRNLETPQVDYLTRNINEDIAVADLVLTEVLQGITDQRTFRTTRQALLNFRVVPIAGRHISLRAADNYRLLRARGITIRKTIDTLIATRCIEEGWPLLYADRDFDPFVTHFGLTPALLQR